MTNYRRCCCCLGMATYLSTLITSEGVRPIYYCTAHAPSHAQPSGPVLDRCGFQRRDERCIKAPGHGGLHYCER